MSLNIEFTNQKEAEEELRRTAERLEALLAIESDILRAESPQAIAEVALEQLERIIPSMSSAVTLFQSSYTEAIMLAGRNFEIIPGKIYPAQADQVAARKQGEAMVIGDIAALPVKSAGIQSVMKLGGHSLLSVPMLAQGELIGMMSLIGAKPHSFSERDTQIARQVANSVAIVLHNDRLLEKEKKARREAETLREVAAILSASLGQEELLDLILIQLERVLPYDRATILLLDGDKLTAATYRGRNLEAPAFFLLSEEFPATIRAIMNNHQPLVVPDTSQDPNWVDFPGGEFVQCWLGIPMATNENFIGILMLDKVETHYYTAENAALAIAFANNAAVAIENANLYSEVQQYAAELETLVSERTRELGALYEIAAIMSQHLELKTTLDKIVAVISEEMEVRTVSIQIINQSRSTLRLAAYKYLSPMMIEYLYEQPVTNPIMARILERRGATLYVDPSSASEITDLPVSEISSYSIVTPIRVKGKNLGILAVAYYRQDEPKREDLALLSSITDHIGVAIENARLRKQSEQLAVLEERERLARDLHDSATQSLFSLTLFSAAAREHLSSGKLELVNRQLTELEKTAVQTHKEMRLMLYELRPTVLKEDGLEEALRQRMQMVEFRSGIRGQITTKLATKLPFSVEEVFFQVANEALNNTLKHSKADSVMINITSDSSYASLSIRDNGQGFVEDDTAFSAGMGIENMRQRVQKMGGTFHYESDPDNGTTVVVNIPLESEDSTNNDDGTGS